MSDAPAPAPPTPPAQKPRGKVSPTRNIVGIVLLIVFGAIAAAEWSAKQKQGAAAKSLEKAVGNDESEMLPQADVEKLLGKAPDGPGVDEDGQNKVSYTWSGLFKKYRLNAYYTREATPHLVKYNTD